MSDSETLELCRLRWDPSAAWATCGAASWAEGEREPERAGPLRQVTQAPFAIVYGGGGGGGRGEDGSTVWADGGGDDYWLLARDAAGGAGAGELERHAVYLANLFVLMSDASPAVVPSHRLRLNASVGAIAGEPTHLILVGGPRDNAATSELASYWRSVGHAAEWTDDGQLRIGGCVLGGTSGVGALVLGPRPGGGLALVIDGDSHGLRDAIAAGEPTIPPMARSPFSNTLPDFIVTGPHFRARGYGGLLAAGFFDYKWAATAAATWFAADCAVGPSSV